MIRVGGIEYHVRCVEVYLNSNKTGETLFDDCIVSILANIPEQKQQQIFWHELVHILYEGEEIGREDLDEAFVTRVSNALFGVLRDNGLLAKDWWRKTVDEWPTQGETIVLSPVKRGTDVRQQKIASREKEGEQPQEII